MLIPKATMSGLAVFWKHFEQKLKHIRRDNPLPTACAMICEHPCEERCDGSNRVAGESFIEVNTEDAEALGIHAQEMIAVVSCIPEYLTEVILGHLKTEGLIHSLEDVESVELRENGQKAMVRISVPLPSGFPDQYTENTASADTH